MERLYPGPYLEMFARRTRDGWTTWGDELPPLSGGLGGDEALILQIEPEELITEMRGRTR